jgi:hypothetical protein
MERTAIGSNYMSGDFQDEIECLGITKGDEAVTHSFGVPTLVFIRQRVHERATIKSFFLARQLAF